jgi:hypothetical protein
MASSLLPMERRADGLPRPTYDNEANLWRTPMVVHMSDQNAGTTDGISRPAAGISGAARATGLPMPRARRAESFAGSSGFLPPKWGPTRRWSGPHSIDARGRRPMAASC